MAICPMNGIVLRMGLLLLATTFCVVPLSPSDAFPWKCYGCRGGVELLRLMYERNATADKILGVADFVCRHFADTDSFVCNGITAQFRDEFLYVLGRLALSPGQLCALLVANCGTPADPFNTNWSVGDRTIHNSITARVIKQRSDRRKIMTGDRWALRARYWRLLVRCPIMREEGKWVEWEKEAIEWGMSHCQRNCVVIDFNNMDIGEGMTYKRKST
uniref:Saposin B-type domain-containing protein n=1 Tax=Globodera pallida TaxID=36090 RepID=A0A183C519_GLOPA